MDMVFGLITKPDSVLSCMLEPLVEVVIEEDDDFRVLGLKMQRDCAYFARMVERRKCLL
jgi:hypothetical protein